MALSVLSVAYPFAPVSADPAGGAEQVLAQIDRALVRAGWRSRVLAQAGSSTAGELIALPAAPGEVDDGVRTTTRAAVRAALADAVRSARVDLIHLHGIDFADYLPATGPPVLATLHLPLGWYPEGALAPGRADVRLNPVSADQARRAPPGARLLPPVPNGVDLDLYAPAPAKDDYALVLGRVAPEKGFHLALDAARRADAFLLAAGRLFPYAAHRAYFDAEVAPRLDDRRRWIGPAEGRAKRRLLARARCVLIPSTAPETSSLVAMEALASGTPVIAFRSGALPGIVEHGRTGFIVDTVEEMADALGRLDGIDPAECRRAAVDRFDVRRTTDAYLDLYRKRARVTRSHILDACARGEISPNIALSRLLLAGEAVDAAALARDAAAQPEAAPLGALQALAERHAGRLGELERLAASGMWPQSEDTFGETARMFDRFASEAPEAAVAFYSLGDPQELAAATAELVEVVRAWSPPRGRRVLDVGCGIGRLSLALADEAREVIGLDISEGMVAEARRRAGDRGGVRFAQSDGRALPVEDGSIDLVLAVDSFPYVVRAGETERFLAEAARALAPGGDLLVFNWSYRGSPPLDEAEARALGPMHGFDVVRVGETPFRIWDAVGFHLRRRA